MKYSIKLNKNRGLIIFGHFNSEVLQMLSLKLLESVVKVLQPNQVGTTQVSVAFTDDAQVTI